MLKEKPLNIAAYIFAGLAMMLNIRLVYSAAPYALLRFKLPENLFSIFVRTMAGSLELWCLPSMVLGNIIDLLDKHAIGGGHKQRKTQAPSDNDLLKFKAGSSQNEINTLRGLANELYLKAQALATAVNSGDGHSQAQGLRDAVGAGEQTDTDKLRHKLKLLYEATAPGHELTSKATAVTSQYSTVSSAFDQVKGQQPTAYNDGDKKAAYDAVVGAWNDFEELYNAFDKPVIRWSSIFWTWTNFATFVILFFVFITGGDEGHVTVFYWVIAASGFVFGINMVFLYAMEWWYLNWYMVGENSFPIVTSFMHYVSILIFGNRRKWNTDYIAVIIDMVISMCIAFIASVLWTIAYKDYSTHPPSQTEDINPAIVSPVIMVLIGMGLVYCIYPGIAPGMIVPFYLIDKIEMVLLIMTCFPPVIVALICKYKYPYSVKAEWKNPSVVWAPANNTFWHTFIFIPPLQICLAAIFIYSLHYRDSTLSRSIINQPKMSTFLSIIFYMCHEIQLALGFPGMVGNKGGDEIMLPVQLIGAFLMVLLAFYSVGYITEYKRHDPSEWPTEGMTKWNALCYWLKMASKITNKNFKQLFTKDLCRDLVFLSIQWIRFHKINKIKYISKFFSIIYN